MRKLGVMVLLAWTVFARGSLYPSGLIASFLPAFTGAIIGTDDRREWYEEPSESIRSMGRATAVLIKRSVDLLRPTRSGWRFGNSVVSHGESDSLCPGERFFHQPAPGYCSGSLVGPDLLLTAAHCLEGCDSAYFVFDFFLSREGRVRGSFHRDQVFTCREIVEQSESEDWAVIRLNRRVPNRTALRLRRRGNPALGTPLAMLGYPRGIPLKISGNAKVVKSLDFSDKDVHFEADLDVFGGNSGSAVVNTRTQEVEGILVVGFGEFESPTTNAETGEECRRLRHIPNPEDAMPAWVTKTSRFAPAVQRAMGKVRRGPSINHESLRIKDE